MESYYTLRLDALLLGKYDGHLAEVTLQHPFREWTATSWYLVLAEGEGKEKKGGWAMRG